MQRAIIFIALLFSFSVNAQITEKFENQDLSQVLAVLQNNYSLKFAYDPDLIKGKKITVNLQNVSIEEALKEILKYSELSFDKVKKNYYTIKSVQTEWTIEGKLLDAKNVPVPYAKVRIIGTYRGTISKEDGSFNLKFKADEAPMVEISSYGYITRKISAEKLKSGAQIVMPFNIVEIPEISVEYLTDGILISKDISYLSIKPTRIGAVPGSTEPDVFQIVQNVPGINSASSTVSEIQIRGGTADQNHMIWDGIPIYHPGHFYGMISAINPNIINNANIHRGVYDPYYGGKASGLIELSSIDYVPSKIRTGVGINMLQADAYVIAPLGKNAALLVSGRRSYMDLWKSPTYNQYSNRVYQSTAIENTGEFVESDSAGTEIGQSNVENNFFYYDLNAKFIYQIDSNNLLTASGLYTRNKLKYFAQIFEEDEYATTDYLTRNAGGSVRYNHIWNKNFNSTILGSFASYRYSFDAILEAGADTIEVLERNEKSNYVQHYSVNWDNEWKISELHKLRGGYQASFMAVNYSFLSGDDYDSTVQSGANDVLSNALHLNYTFDKKNLLLKFGVRATHYALTNKIYAEPRIYGQYKLAKWVTFKAGFAIQNQFISQVDPIDESIMGLSNRTWVMADNDEIPVINSTVFNTGFVINHKGWRIDVDGYFKQINDIVNFSDIPSLSSGFLRGDAGSMGIDFLIKKRWKSTRSWITYSLSDVKYYFGDLYTTEFVAPFNQPHTFKWVLVHDWRQFEFSMAFKVASGKPYTPIKEIVPNGNTDPDAGLDDQNDIIYGDQNSKKLPTFHQLDFTVFYNFPKSPDKKWKGKIGVSCFNVYNHSNLLSRSFELDINDDGATPELSVVTIETLFLKITPNVTLQFTF